MTDTAAPRLNGLDDPRPLVHLDFPGVRDGQYLADGPDNLRLEFRYDSAQCSSAWGVLHEATADAQAGAVAIVLGDETFLVDPNLQMELLAHIVVLMVDMDLGPLLALYPPDPGPPGHSEG
jgi:hypothetical protein